MRKKYREVKYEMGAYLDVQIYPVFRQPVGRRGPRFKPTAETQQRLNRENSIKYVDRLTHKNFRPGDYGIDLTYKTQPTDEHEALKYMQNYIRRLKKLYKAADADMKYIYVTEQGLKNGRFHHHMIISSAPGISRDMIENAWQVKYYAGYCNCVRLQFGTTGIAGKIAYIMGRQKEKQEARRCGFRRWNCSKNLVKPEPRKNDSRYSNKTAEALFGDCDNRQAWERLYPEYYFAECDRVYYNPINGGYYISARLYKKRGGANDKAIQKLYTGSAPGLPTAGQGGRTEQGRAKAAGRGDRSADRLSPLVGRPRKDPSN